VVRMLRRLRIWPSRGRTFWRLTQLKRCDWIVDVRRQPPLPVGVLVPDIIASLRHTPNLVIEAEPGAGKTTRIPAALLAAFSGQVLVPEPRRIAARLAARRVAWELNEDVGQTVGYQVRYERVAGPRTRLHFLTEGVLTRRLLSDPELDGVDAVVLDEFHGRHLESDLALALLKRFQIANSKHGRDTLHWPWTV
jgi:ATP-dependent helicase HrpB